MQAAAKFADAFSRAAATSEEESRAEESRRAGDDHETLLDALPIASAVIGRKRRDPIEFPDSQFLIRGLARPAAKPRTRPNKIPAASQIDHRTGRLAPRSNEVPGLVLGMQPW